MILRIKVKPNSKAAHLTKDQQGQWVLKIKSAPVQGKANEEVIRTLAAMLHQPKSAIIHTGGFTGPHKRFRIDTLEEAEVIRLLENQL